MNDAVFKKHGKWKKTLRHIKLVTTKTSLYQTCNNWTNITIFFLENVLAIELKKKLKNKKNPQILINKPVKLGLSILDITKIVMNFGMIM